MIEFISQPWPWYISGPLIAFIMLTLLFFGETFGVSANLRTLCTMCGANKFSDFFHFEWKKQIWNIVVIVGAIGGGFIAHEFLTIDESVVLSESTVASLQELGFTNIGSSYVPDELFGTDALASGFGWAFLIVGGFMVGFGTRYGGGCTSGHAISGLSNLQLPSLIAVIGFFIGGLITTFLILPLIL